MRMTLEQAADALRDGGVIAYPTEAVYGLGCDPSNAEAVQRLLHLKARDVRKGVLLISDQWQRVQPWTAPVPKTCLERALQTWPGPHTWVFPASERVPDWIRGAHPSVAVRITDHPIAKQLCAAFAGPIVSTSANVAGDVPADSAEAVRSQFGEYLAGIVEGPVGQLARPTPIQDVQTGRWIRR